jgi:hypothetical protein
MTDEAVAVSIVSFLPKLQLCVSVGDYVKYSDGAHKEGLGEVVCIGASSDLSVKNIHFVHYLLYIIHGLPRQSC